MTRFAERNAAWYASSAMADCILAFAPDGLPDVLPDAFLDATLRRLAALRAPEGGLFLVGGGVRDLLLGRSVKDVDLACRNARQFASDLTQDLAQDLGARLVPLGQDHDPPSFRVVLRPPAHNARTVSPEFLDITEIHGRDIFEDLARRDFTANAMAVSLGTSPACSPLPFAPARYAAASRGLQLIDPHGGRADVRAGLVRRTGPRTIAEDPLRILRGFRLRAQLGWTIDPATLRDMARHVQILAALSGERVAAELRLILDCPQGGFLLRELDQVGALAALFPETTPMRGCIQNHFHHLDVFAHSLAAVEASEAVLSELTGTDAPLREMIQDHLEGYRLPWLKLAVLLHDVGKPKTKGRNLTTGQATFYGHDALGADMAERITARLRLSSSERHFITSLIRHHLHIGVLLFPKATKKARLRWMRRLGPALIPTVLLCLADIRATRGPRILPGDREIQEEQGIRLIQEYAEQAQTTLIALPLLTGHDLIAQGIAPGPALGRLLKTVQEAQDAGEITTTEDALALIKTVQHQTNPKPTNDKN